MLLLFKMFLCDILNLRGTNLHVIVAGLLARKSVVSEKIAVFKASCSVSISVKCFHF